jgi:hypothetical protein
MVYFYLIEKETPPFTGRPLFLCDRQFLLHRLTRSVFPSLMGSL